MFIQKITNNLLTHRLDSTFYNPIAIEAQRILDKNSKIQSLSKMVDPKRPITNGVRGPDWEKSKFKLVRLQDCKDWFVDYLNCRTIGATQFKENKRCSLQRKDIVVAIGGYVGNASIVNEEGLAVIGQHSAMLSHYESKVDPYYLVTYLNTKYAEIIFQRYVSGTVQAGVNLEDLRDIEVPCYLLNAQKYIGNKVRQAETLRAWSKGLEEDVWQYHIDLIPTQTTLRFGRKTRSVFAAKMTDRLDAHFYPAVVEDYLKTSEVDFKILNQLCLSVFNGQTQPERTEELCEQITVTSLSSSFLKGKTRWVKKPAKNDKYLKPHDLLICNAAHNKAYIGREITYVHSEKPLLPSTEVMVIRTNRDLLPASYIRSYLFTKLGFIQLQSTIRGITAHSYPADVKQLDIPIPKIPKEKKGRWFACDDLMAKAGLATEVSGLLTNAAKQLVEALIENKLTEQELINAQQALEGGDTTLDHQILSRLTTKGIDHEDSPPLFPDLDPLYDLLEKAEESLEVTP